MRIRIELTEADLRRLVMEEIRNQLGELGDDLEEKDVKIETKSAQNYRSEWESGAGFRAVYEGAK